MKDLYKTNLRHWKKKLKDSRWWKDYRHSCSGRIKTVKMIILPKAIYRFNTVPIKIPMILFAELWGKVYGNKRPCIVTETQSRKNSQQYLITWFQTILHIHSGKNRLIVVLKRNTDHPYILQNPEIKPHSYRHLNIEKSIKNMHLKKAKKKYHNNNSNKPSFFNE